MPRQSPSISTRDVQDYLQRRTKLCDSRIENAHVRLCSRNSEGQPATPEALEHRTLSSSCNNLPARKQLVIDTVTRPTSAFERCVNAEEKPRGILKKTQSPVANLGRKISPDEWFQRVMHEKKLSPIDLCDLFSYGDARKHPLVSLSHVCEVLFDLDPEAANGADPFTDEMEEFLYQFATESKGEILVNIREALRALNIWQSRATFLVVPSKLASDPQSKAKILESKNKKLQQVISSLQDANLRLSRQLDSVKLSRSSEESSSRPSRGKASTLEGSPVEHETRHSQTFPPSSRHKTPNSSRKLSVVNLHEQELVEMASQLQYSGVKRLEELLIQGDAESTGFVNLKQLCWILADQFDLKVSEVRLIEVCMGMNFNAGAQLDYKEFLNVLMDILIYALPDIRESAKRNCLLRLDEYFQSGFPPGREEIRQLLGSLCSKFDLEDDRIITIADLIRVFHVELVKHHALELPFPLEEHETIQLAQPFIQRKAKDKGFLNYAEFLEGLLGYPLDFNSGDQRKRAFQWDFWQNIYMSLCSGDSRMGLKVQTQLDKIMAKIDPEGTFMISTRHFARVFERHLSPEDMEVLSAVLEVPDRKLRYDVLLNLVFGSPPLNDDTFFETCIRKKLLREQKRIGRYLTDLLAEKSSHSLQLPDFYDVFIVQAQEEPLSTVEMLFVLATMDSRHEGAVKVKTLQEFLSMRCWKDKKSHKSDKPPVTEAESARSAVNNVEDIKKLVVKSCSEYDLLGKVDALSRNSQGWVSQEVLLKEVDKMLQKTGNGVQQEDLKPFVQDILKNTNSRRDGIHCDAFFDALIDWEAVANRLRLPHSLVEVKKVLEKFDWDHIGVIPCEDWNKAYRLMSVDRQDMAQWEVKVLQRRFPGPIQHHERLKIDYDHFILFLLEFQQRQARKSLQVRVVKLFQQRLPSTVSTAELERVYRALDTNKKGYFNAADLKLYLTKEFELESDQEPVCTELLSREDALASVMRLLAGDKAHSSASSDNPPVVSFQRFREIASSFNLKTHKTSNLGNQIALQGDPSSSKSDASASQTVSSLRTLEIAILDIASEFSDLKGNILPTRAFRYFSVGPSEVSTRPSSPLQRSVLNSPTRGSSHSRTQRELEACDLDPLTPAGLKRLLVNYHSMEVSAHLVSQFFLHIGSPSKHFLDLLHFAQWVAPLSVELQVKVRGVVRQMIVKGKAGGGRLDLDRFIAQLQRRLQDSPQYMANKGTQEDSALQFVTMPLLLSKLHQLNIPLHKQELMTLFRHFGMEENLENVDYALFLQRLYELNTF